MARHLASAFAAASLCVSPALAQGSDNCASATPIAGAGTFVFSNGSATSSPEGQGHSACNYFGSTQMQRDVWFVWTSPATDTFVVRTCGLTGIDTKMAAYLGNGCPSGPPLACNDDACAFQSSIQFNATAGTTYAIQIAVYPGASGGTGSFEVIQGGPPPCSTSTGADVIVGDLMDVGNYAALGSLDSIALGTNACNIGTAPLGWSGGTPNHPVIGQNLYRYKQVDGAWRFEQIGMSWLKHGFAAVAGTLCCTTCTSGGGGLGIGCSDPYGSGLNGNQGSLGPRWEVNAHTGVFAHPHANPPWSGTTARRSEFLLADIEVGTGTRYFGEGQYVTPDDSAAGNQNNNASWREVVPSGTTSNYSFAFLGGTRRAEAAIRVWAEIDPEVTLTDVQVPGDGLFVLGSRATDLGGGTWRYEYALFNMNSHRSAGSFSVPLPAGANASNFGFHDVTYRNGDGPGHVNFSNADWTASFAGGSVTWTTETEAQNVRANAVRWGTLYNFRFDADVPPANGDATIGLWRAGSPGAMPAGARVPGPTNTSFALCFGDGSGTSCPCGNNSAAGAMAGCLNSLGTAGALAVAGTASVSADSLVLAGSGMTDSTCVYYQGETSTGGGVGAVFGDGLRCAGGFLVRLAPRTNVAGASSYPSAGDAPVSVRGADLPGDVRTYQIWYRNSAAFCTPDGFNLTNAWQLVWQM